MGNWEDGKQVGVDREIPRIKSNKIHPSVIISIYSGIFPGDIETTPMTLKKIVPENPSASQGNIVH